MPPDDTSGYARAHRALEEQMRWLRKANAAEGSRRLSDAERARNLNDIAALAVMSNRAASLAGLAEPADENEDVG